MPRKDRPLERLADEKTKFERNLDREGALRYSAQVKPIRYLKANAADILLSLAERREPMVITQNGEAKAVIPGVASFEQTQETLALLKVLAIGNQHIDAR